MNRDVSMAAVAEAFAGMAHEVCLRRLPAQKAMGEGVRGRFWVVRNPTRSDKTPGSFRVCISGAGRGQWVEEAPPRQWGDLLDLLVYLGVVPDLAEAKLYAMQQLGWDHGDPVKIREIQQRNEERAQRDQEEERRAAAKKAKLARAIYLDAAPLANTPAAAYLRGRGLDPAAFDALAGRRSLNALRYADQCPQGRDRRPAMVATIVVPGEGQIAVHRTFLTRRPDGSWGKATDLPDPKMTLGHYRGRGAFIPLWKGSEKGRRTAVAEGIENAGAFARSFPEIRVVAAVALSNLGGVAMPDGTEEVIVVSDGVAGVRPDHDDEAAAAFDRKADEAEREAVKARDAYRARGFAARLWRPAPGFKDINDQLQAQQAKEAAE